MAGNSSDPLLYATLSDAIHHHLKYSLGKTRENCSQGELFLAVGLAPARPPRGPHVRKLRRGIVRPMRSGCIICLWNS